MKKTFIITLLFILALNTNAQDIFSVGYFEENNRNVAALYKNNELLYSVQKDNLHTLPTTISYDSSRNIYWMVNVKNGNTILYTEVWKNNQLYVTTEGLTGVRITDLYCQNDTLYYVGHYTNEDDVTVAMVWKGTNFIPQWQLGDGIHNSFIYDVAVDRQTGMLYFCGYVIDGKKKAAVWEEQNLLYTFDQDSINSQAEITASQATQIAVENGNVYTIGNYTIENNIDVDAVWLDNAIINSAGPYFENIHSLCIFENTYYYAYFSRDQMYDAIMKDGQEMFRLNYACKLLSTSIDIYVVGQDFDNKGCIWKNFQVFQQPENCKMLYGMVEVEASNPPDNYYGFLYQPDSAVIYLNPNQPYGANYDQMDAGFRYKSNGLLERSYVETYLEYGHWMSYYYDADYHVIEERCTYFSPTPDPYQNNYTYEDGLLVAYTQYYDNYHEDEMILVDSISYSYDELRRLQAEKRFIKTTSEKAYEYNENQVIITTDGYTNGTFGEWLTLSRETCTFSEDSLLLSSETEKYNDSTVLVTYGYDGQGHRTSILTQKRNNGVWENQKLVQYHFNPYGRLTLAEIKLWQDDAFVDAHRAVYELNEMGYPAVVTFEKWNGDAWETGVWQPDFYLYDEDHLKQQNDLLYRDKSYVNKIEISYLVTDNPREQFLPDGAEWYYEILNDDGTITYQHLQCTGDTTINGKRPKVIVRSNTQYDKEGPTEVTREYVYEENGIVYWWNKDLEEFTTLYNLTADTGDEWEIKVGGENLILHVDTVGVIDYWGKLFKTLRVSDANGYYCGRIVCGIGHLTSFFPERLMNQGKGFRVEGLRCYWVEGGLVYQISRDDCDAIFAELHYGIDEETKCGFDVYPNPANNVLIIETQGIASLQPTYRIINVMGQTLQQGIITDETQRIDIANLKAGMYFITVNEKTVKFVKE